jgi:hypothetical protein
MSASLLHVPCAAITDLEFSDEPALHDLARPAMPATPWSGKP